ncbi:MAG: MBL fold metallo-hydrolase [Rubrobacteraceae bacterium]
MTGCADIQQVVPVENQTERLADVEYVEPSAERKIEPGQQVDSPVFPPPGEWIVQRLTDRDYWLYADAYSVTAHVGDEGVLLVDAPYFHTVDGLFGAVERFADLPVVAVVYTHSHADHVGATRRIQAAMRERGVELRIIASERCRREISWYRNQVAAPTEVVADGHGSFEFEGRVFKHVTPVEWAHSGADSYTITPEGVISFDDFVQAGCLPQSNVSNVQNMNGYIEFVRRVAGETSWQFANFGHVNIGSRADVERTLDYFRDIHETCFQMLSELWGIEAFGQLPKEMLGNQAVVTRNAMDMAVGAIAERLEEKWSHIPHFEVARDHVERVMCEIGMYYDITELSGGKPEFTPLAP